MFRSQKNNVVGGDLVNGDKNEVHNHYTAIPSVTRIAVLNERLKHRSDAPSDDKREFIEELKHYMERATNSDVRGLAEKLNAADRADFIYDAQELKERATKKIMALQTSETAQDFFAVVLSDLHTSFNLHVRPRIQAGDDRATIDALIAEKVIAPVSESLGENVLKVYSNELFGLIFFLGGNCHIRWDKC